ncbi:DUF5615 family PIN-like protein [Bradyrhizobium diazoefficiens]|nr:DUF5615 family PIN-like protein [Bradyrhizobium diazoefficiens]MBR0769093.1 DUF5615 family PIN-like protein [Bradyrhizobium diazoefficiens]
MPYLVDAQLPPALAEAMRRAGYDAAHVAEFGMANATDRAIWNEAVARSAVLVTKDRDFSLLRAAKRQGPIALGACRQHRQSRADPSACERHAANRRSRRAGRSGH